MFLLGEPGRGETDGGEQYRQDSRHAGNIAETSAIESRFHPVNRPLAFPSAKGLDIPVR
jgi:hypothetical protein